MKPNRIFKTLSIFISVFIVLLFVLSCSKPQSSGELRTINILDVEKSELKISEIAESIEYLPLASDSVLSPLSQVNFINDCYYVKDHKSKFLRFDKNGNLLNKIGNRGRGPGEYRYASEFIVHPDGNIYISGGKQGKIMVFSQEGKFIRSFDISQKDASSFGLSSNNFLFFYGPGMQHLPVNVELTDTEGTVHSSYKNKYEFERGKASIGFIGECLMYSLKGQLYFKEIFSDTLFTLKGSELIPEIILNSGERKFTSEARTKMIQETSKDPRVTSETWVYSLIQNNLFESSNYLFYSYGFNKKGRLLIHNKVSGKSIEVDSKTGIENDLDGGPNIQLKMNKDDNTLFSWINAFELITYVASDDFINSTPKYPEKKKELEKLANNLNENDNPVLMLVKLKE
jgi:hypothetical protein